MPQKLVAEVRGVTNLKISGGVDKRRGVDAQLLAVVKFSIPGGNISKLSALLDLEKVNQEIRVHFYTEDGAQASMDGALADQAAKQKPCPNCLGVAEIKEDVEGGKGVMVPCHICHGTGKVAQDFVMTEETTGSKIIHGVTDLGQGTSGGEGGVDGEGEGGLGGAAGEGSNAGEDFSKLGEERGRLEQENPAPAPPPKRRGRGRPPKTAAALETTVPHEAGNPGGNGHGAAALGDAGEGEEASAGVNASE